MALDFRIHWKTFTRVDINPKVKSEFWSDQFADIRCLFNFDGELWGLGDHIDDLIEAGFRGPFDDAPECCVNPIWNPPNWLELYTIMPQDKAEEPFEAIGLVSGASDLVQSHRTQKVFTRNVDSDWELPMTK